MRIVWAPEAADDLETAVAYLAQRNPAGAHKLALAVFELVERLADEPLDGPEHILRNGERVRGWPLPPFRLYYQRQSAAFRVVRLYHQKREPITL